MSKIMIRFYSIADYEEEEIWLRQQHNQGLQFIKMIPPCFYVFEECAPEDVIYRLDYKNGNVTSDYKQMFQDYGWEYIDSCAGWMYFRKHASEIQKENDGEIFSDAESRVNMIQHIFKTRMFPVFLIFLCFILPIWGHTFSGTLEKADFFSTGFFSAIFVLYLFILIHCGRKLTKLRRKYKSE